MSAFSRKTLLLAGGATFAAFLLAGAPTAALAANECGDPTTNGATADIFTCAGSYSAITYPTTSGALTLNLQNNVSTTTGGIVVTVAPTANTAVTIGRIADSPANSGDPQIVSTTGAAIQITRAVGANVTVNLSDTDTADAPMVVSGTTAGVLIQNAGGAGLINTTFTSTNGTITASAGAGLDLSTTSTAAAGITVNNGSAVSGSTYGVRVASAGTGISSITNSASGVITGGTGAILGASGARIDVINAGTINGRVTLNNTDQSAIVNSGTWTFTGESLLNAGVTTLNNQVGGVISTSGSATLNFAGGYDTFDNDGTLRFGASGAATLTVANLEDWDNTGPIVFGGDGAANDRLVVNGALFAGSFDSALIMDVDLTADQADCSAAVAADCLDLRDGTTSGSTIIHVNNVAGGIEPGHELVLVDVSGVGSSTVAAFQLDPTTPGYRRVGDADTVQDGAYFYGLIYDPVARQHLLVTGFNDNAYAASRIGRAATEPWRTVATTSQNRQADLRGAGENRGGVWLKAAGVATNEKSVDLGAQQVRYDAGFDQRTTALMAGADLIGGSQWLVGVLAGKLDSTLDYTALDSELELDGYAFGAYGSFTAGRLYVDAVAAMTDLDLTHKEAGVPYEGSASTFGFQAEAGWRLIQLGDDGVYFEPLVAVSHVTTEVDDMTTGAGAADFDEVASTRGAFGLRVGGNVETGSLTTRLSFTGRVWQEFEGENTVTFAGSSLIDSRQDTLGDVGVGVGVLGMDGRLSADLGYGLTFRESYTSNEASVSLRFNW